MTEQEADPIFRKALEWFVLMQDEGTPNSERQACDEWIAARAEHRYAYERAETLWGRFEIIRPEYEQIERGRVLSRRNVMLGGVAVLLAGAGGTAWLRSSFDAGITTAMAERRTISLPDGSKVELGSYSAMSVDFSERRRHLVLHRGEAFFEVAGGIDIPFIVSAAGGSIRALGTQFDVKVVDAACVVAVIEHSVLVEAGSSSIRVDEGWQVTLDPGGLGTARKIDAAAVVAWREDRVVFVDVPLRTVLRELQRYRHGKIVLLSDRVGDTPVTAIFETTKADQALKTIAQTLPIRVFNADGFITFVASK